MNIPPLPAPPAPARRRLRLTVPLLALALLAPACGGDSSYSITDVRSRPATPTMPAPAAAARWTYETPKGWKELPPAPMREVGFAVAGRDDALCTFSILEGQGGGILGNLNRWREQMSLDRVDEAALGDLKRVPFLRMQAVQVDLEGHYVGMRGSADIENARLLGKILAVGDITVFLKLTGPADVVAAEESAFEALALSLTPPKPREPAAMPSGDLPPGHPPMTPEAPAAAPARASRLAWEVPEGWTTGPARSMREVTVIPPGAKETACAVSILGGDGGGLTMNLNRWRDQMGVADLTDEEIEALPRIPSLGTEGVLVQIEGKYTGMGDANVDGAVMLGFVALRDGHSVFVKMTGPAGEVLPHRKAFEAFCASLTDRK